MVIEINKNAQESEVSTVIVTNLPSRITSMRLKQFAEEELTGSNLVISMEEPGRFSVRFKGKQRKQRAEKFIERFMSRFGDNSGIGAFIQESQSQLWIKLESNRYAFKVKFKDGVDIYDLKKLIKLEVKPKLDHVSSSDIVLCSPASLGMTKFQDNLDVSELLCSFGGNYQSPWIVQVTSIDTISDRHRLYFFSLSNITLPKITFPSNIVEKPCSVLLEMFSSINFFTILYVGCSLLEFEPFPVYSATSLLLFLHFVCYSFLKMNPDIEENHFTCSAEHLKMMRFWTPLTSTFAHLDINHLILNVVCLLDVGPILEKILGWKSMLEFYFLASFVSSLVSALCSRHPSIGSSGALYAMIGYVVRFYRADIVRFLFEQALFLLATDNSNVDHFSHFGGFVFGFLLVGLRGNQKC
jgi:membrane associated rhomboid family serine protease